MFRLHDRGLRCSKHPMCGPRIRPSDARGFCLLSAHNVPQQVVQLVQLYLEGSLLWTDLLFQRFLA